MKSTNINQIFIVDNNNCVINVITKFSIHNLRLLIIKWKLKIIHKKFKFIKNKIFKIVKNVENNHKMKSIAFNVYNF